MPRMLFALLLLAAPLVAQEAPAPPTQAQFRAWLADLESRDAARREQALQKLRALDAQGFKTLLEGLETPLRKGTEFRIQLGGTGNQESIQGTWVEQGRSGTYVLEGDGSGRYRLKAERAGAKVIEDRGTLSELMRKHRFLGPGMLLTILQPRRESVWVKSPTAKKTTQGLQVSPTSEVLRYQLMLPEGAGLVVDKVVKGSRAEKLGLRRLDVLVRLDGRPLDSAAQLAALAGKKGKLEIVRRGKSMVIDLAGEPTHSK